VQFLSRASAVAGGLAEAGTLRGRALRLQQRGVVLAEDHYLRRIPASTEVLFCSEWLGERFRLFYPPPPRHAVLANPGPPSRPAASTEERRLAREQFELPPDTPVVGFLGGCDPRKGYQELVARVAAEDGVQLLLAGSGTDPRNHQALGDRLHAPGHLARDSLPAFFAAIDALAVPSRFDPWAVVVNEACAHGVPVLVSPSAGAHRAVAHDRAGLVWDAQREPLGPLLATLAADRDGYSRRAIALADRLSFAVQGEKLLAHVEAAADRNRRQHDRT
jgi:glycosyltransferase involved in cell wall biosynthesis